MLLELVGLFDIIISLESSLVVLGQHVSIVSQGKYFFVAVARIILIQILENLVINDLHRLSLMLSFKKTSEKRQGLVFERVFWVEAFVEFYADV